MENENKINQAYRKYMAAELARPEVQAGKEQLMAFFEAPAPAPVFSMLSAGFAAPAVALLSLFLVFHQIQLNAPVAEGPSAPLYQSFNIVRAEKTYQPQPLDNPVENHMKPRVVVKRVSSRVGPTMVYQKVYRDVPVTIVWVFNHGGTPV